MRNYRIGIDLGNDAFADGAEGIEVARILRRLANRCEVEGTAIYDALIDLNGHVVGHASIKGKVER